MIDNLMTRVKVNNEIDFCEIVATQEEEKIEIRHKIEAALQRYRVSYFLRWQEPSFLGKVFFHEETRMVFCINDAQLEDAMKVFEDLSFTEKEVLLLGEKAKNKSVYSEH